MPITDQDRELRNHMRMRAFTFMLDDVTKVKVLKRLREAGCDSEKGTLSALIRVLLNEFAALSDDQVLTYLLAEVEKEYLYTTKKNKRSTM
ncbi:MAG: hypothetical protein IKW20_08215 [Bacteroidales bacterium]|nr:hypothetical protein [Bacteroidales bacterium]